MGKKLPLLISTLTCFASGIGSAAASAVDYIPVAWTYEEMAALNAEIEPEINANCGDEGPMCYDSYVDMNKSGDIYRALTQYRSHGLTVTAINPYNHTVRMAYDNGILSSYSPEKLLVKDIYLVQGEDGYYIGNYVSAIDNNQEDELEHIKTLLVRKAADDNDAWFPAQTEVEFSLPDFIFDDLKGSNAETAKKYYNKLYLGYRMSGSNSQWGDQFEFSSCLASLEEGMECQIRYKANTLTYVPAVITQNEGEHSNVTDDGGLGGGEATGDTSADTVVDTVASTDAVVSDTVSTTVTDTELATTPDTGEATADASYSAEFPWWLGIVFVASLATLAWLFWPFRKKSSKKS